MANFPTWTPVVALALRDREGRILLQQRLPDKHHGGLWEFPGGKVESMEVPRLALVREVAEELGIVLDPAGLRPLLLADEGRVEGVVLFLYTATRWTGTIVPHDGQAWGWFTAQEAASLPLAPMDRDLLTRLD